MHRSLIATLVPTASGTEPSEALVAGFVVAVRVLKRMIFLIVQDRTGRLQVTIDRAPAGEPPRVVEQCALDLTIGSAVRVRGNIVANAAVKVGGIELLASSLELVSRAEPGLPVDEHSASDLQLDWRFLSLRRPENLLVFEVQTTMERAMREYWAAHEFLELHSPKLMHSASESGADTFATPYF